MKSTFRYGDSIHVAGTEFIWRLGKDNGEKIRKVSEGQIMVNLNDRLDVILFQQFHELIINY